MTDGNGIRVAGAAMIAAAVGILLAMGHHPSGPHSGPLGGIVHGAMIGLLTVVAWGFVTFCIERGAARPLISAGLIAYAIRLFAHIGAATINGFVVPALANASGPPVDHDLFRMAWFANQALAKLGVYMTGAAYVLWSLDLVRGQSKWEKATGALGLAAGAVPAMLLASGVLRMDVAGAFLVYAAHVGWAALVGLMMMHGGFQPSRKAATSS